jgi:hypothetical protein
VRDTYYYSDHIRIAEATVTKLTLSIDEAIVDKAKQLAEANHTSVSAMFSQFVQAMDAREAQPAKIGPLTRKLSGIASLPPGKDYKQVLSDALADKYGVGE